MQKTIKNKVRYRGIGLHSGEDAFLTLLPAPVYTGIKFKIKEKGTVKACVLNVIKSDREVVLRENGIEVRTVEHILAALSGCKIDNVYIELEGPELPIGDGSSKTYVDLIKDAEIIEQEAKKEAIKIDSPLWIEENDRQIIVLPADEFKITYLIEHNDSVIGLQYAFFSINEEMFVKEIAPARTFGFLSEVEDLRKKGLIKGGSLENAVVIGKDRILNDNLRFENELVRHKILDLIGDISLVGCSIVGHFIALKSGHDLNIKLAKKIVEKYKI
ncbi:MAG: UDP-3-O-acyl-N-acetylglucosamine deacetylase [bacterium]|nr:UDP-3-O-acyl-N-acetylglucosamine deacetylase [bacterium]